MWSVRRKPVFPIRPLELAGPVARYLLEGSLSRPGILRLSTLSVDFGLARASFVQAKIVPRSGQARAKAEL